jgi:hypothetical protein
MSDLRDFQSMLRRFGYAQSAMPEELDELGEMNYVICENDKKDTEVIIGGLGDVPHAVWTFDDHGEFLEHSAYDL